MESVILAIIALVIGLAGGWYFGTRPLADWRARYEGRDAEARELDEKFRRAITDLAAASERAKLAETLSIQLEEARKAQDASRNHNAALAAEVAALKADAANFADRERLLLEAQTLLKKEFEMRVKEAKIFEL